MAEETKVFQVDRKYRVVFEQAAVKGIIGFKVEVNGDDMAAAQIEATSLLEWVKGIAPVAPVGVKE